MLHEHALSTASSSLQLSNQEYHDILMNAPIGIFTATPEGKILGMNPAFVGMLGYDSPHELIESVEDIGRQLYADPEARKKMMNCLEKSGEGYRFESRFIRKDGSLFWASNTARVVKDDNGNLLYYQSFLADITELKQRQEKLEKSERKYRFLTEEVPDTIWTLGPDMKPRYVSLNSSKVLGFSPEERLNQHLSEMVTPETYARTMDVFARELKKEETGNPDPDRTITIEMEYYHKDGHTVWLENKIHAIRDNEGRVEGLHGISRDITAHKKMEADLKKSFERLRRGLRATVQAIAATVEARDPYTAGHQRRVADLARAIATEMKLTREEINGIRTGAIIHDLGKISIPAELLSKPGMLTELEFCLIKNHPQAGYNILKDMDFPWPVARMILEHHERMDGSGYPHGLQGNEMLIESRILAVADVVEAMASHRPYRSARGVDTALHEIEGNRGVLYDTDVADACLALFREKDFQFRERLPADDPLDLMR